jgi:hypothetical protein
VRECVRDCAMGDRMIECNNECYRCTGVAAAHGWQHMGGSTWVAAHGCVRDSLQGHRQLRAQFMPGDKGLRRFSTTPWSVGDCADPGGGAVPRPSRGDAGLCRGPDACAAAERGRAARCAASTRVHVCRCALGRFRASPPRPDVCVRAGGACAPIARLVQHELALSCAERRRTPLKLTIHARSRQCRRPPPLLPVASEPTRPGALAALPWKSWNALWTRRISRMA